MANKQTLKQILASNQRDIEQYVITPRELPSDELTRIVFVGVRCAGKSFLLYQKMQQLLTEGHGWNEMLYLNFEDDRLENFTIEDFELILECHAEMYDTRPMLFLDEIQNVIGWEKFARRLADTKYKVWITGSNAKMFSSEIMTTLGGRYMTYEVYPYCFIEYLRAIGFKWNQNTLLATEDRAKMLRHWNEYLHWGGLPESVGLSIKRDNLSSTFQKIYLGDICNRNKISNSNTLRLLLKKLAENVCRFVTYNRLAHVLSSVHGKITTPTVKSYIEYCEAAWLLLRLRNINAPFTDRETSCKYYFVDNGILNLFLINAETLLLENTVALALFRRYGHDTDNERVFFYNKNIEVDFYVPEDKLAIQVSYSISNLSETREREVGALMALPKVLPCEKRLILTNDEQEIIHDSYGTIEVIPVWKWLLNNA